MDYKRIGDITTVVTGGTPSTGVSEYWDNGDIPWLQSGCCQNCDVTNADKFITQFGYENSNTRMMPPNTVMIALTGATAGKVGYLNFEACGNQSITGILPCNLLDQRYLFYYLMSQRSRILSDCIGGAQPHISQGYVKDLVVPVLPINEQREVSYKLCMTDELISAYKHQIIKLNELVKSRFIELFGSLHDNEKGLDIVTIEDACTLIKDGTHQTPTYTEDKQNGFKFLSSKDVMTQKVCWEDIKYIPADLHEKLYATIQPRRNDILMSKNGVNYGVAAVNDTDEIFDIYVSLALLRPRVDRVNPVYFRCAINNPDTKRQFDGSIKGIGVPNLHLGEIKKTKILLPPMSKQNEFAAFVEQTDKSKLAVQESIEKLETLKKSLMQKYFG